MRTVFLTACVLLLWGGMVFAQGDGGFPRFSPDQDFYAEAALSRASVYVGEAVVHSFWAYSASPVQAQYVPPDFAGFWQGEQVVTVSAELVGGRQYVVTLTETVLYPLRAGTLTVAAGVLRVPETVFNAGQELRTDPLTLTVLPLPEDAPVSFSGAVGRFDAALSADADTVALGTPLTITLTITGSGSLVQVPRPPLPLPEFWRAYPDPAEMRTMSQGAARVQARVFRWRAVPDAAGRSTFPPLNFTYFDPADGRYVTLTPPLLSVEVLPGEGGLLARPDLPDAVSEGAGRLPLVTGTGGSGLSVPVLLWLAGPVILLGAWGGLHGHALIRRQRVRRRQRRALATARDRLSGALAAESRQGFALVEAAVLGYVYDRSGGRITGGPAAVREAFPTLESVLVRAEDGRYVPLGVIPLDGLVHDAAAALVLLESAWGEGAA